jgi:hypothetical protein
MEDRELTGKTIGCAMNVRSRTYRPKPAPKDFIL